MKSATHALALILLAASAAPVSAQAGSYSFQNLGIIGATNALDINNANAILGYVRTAQGIETPALFSGASTLDLGIIGLDYVRALNNNGAVAGSSYYQGTNYAAVWTGSSLVRLTNPGGSFNQAVASDISDNGLVVGTVSNHGSNATATVWVGSPIILARIPGTTNEAVAVNNNGQIAGSINYPGSGGSRATLWTGSSVIDLGTLGGTSSTAQSINDAGIVVGYSNLLGDAAVSAAVWENGVGQSLGLLPSGRSSYALDINEAGAVVGYTTVSGNTPTLRATLWQASVAFDLNTYLLASVQDDGWILTVASGINDEGSVVGMAYNTISATYSPFLLVAAAVPEPSTSLSVLIGLGVLASIRHGRRAHSRS